MARAADDEGESVLPSRTSCRDGAPHVLRPPAHRRGNQSSRTDRCISLHHCRHKRSNAGRSAIAAGVGRRLRLRRCGRRRPVAAVVLWGQLGGLFLPQSTPLNVTGDEEQGQQGCIASGGAASGHRPQQPLARGGVGRMNNWIRGQLVGRPGSAVWGRPPHGKRPRAHAEGPASPDSPARLLNTTDQTSTSHASCCIGQAASSRSLPPCARARRPSVHVRCSAGAADHAAVIEGLPYAAAPQEQPPLPLRGASWRPPPGRSTALPLLLTAPLPARALQACAS